MRAGMAGFCGFSASFGVAAGLGCLVRVRQGRRPSAGGVPQGVESFRDSVRVDRRSAMRRDRGHCLSPIIDAGNWRTRSGARAATRIVSLRNCSPEFASLERMPDADEDARDGAASLAVSGSHVPAHPHVLSRNSWRSGASTTVRTGNRAVPPLPISCAGKSAMDACPL
jgi:hypothetical protein